MNEARQKRLEDVINFTDQEVATIVKKLRDSSDWKNKILLLILATGRRSVDILKVTPIPLQAPDGKNGETQITITNASKSPKYEKNTRFPYDIPLLFIPYSEMVIDWTLVRSKLGDDVQLSNIEMTNKYNSMLNSRLRRVIGNKFVPGTRIGSHMLRKIYGAEAIRLYKPDNIENTVYINKVLGHVKGNLDVP